MKTIGREVLFIPARPGSVRDGEGSFARLSDGRILFAYTEYYGENFYDHGIAHIVGCYSADEGERWTEPALLLEKDAEAVNIMSPSLMILSDGALGMVYLRKAIAGGKLSCDPWFRRSDDFGASWGDPVHCVEEAGYYCAVNDCVCVHGGRIYLPASSHSMYTADGCAPADPARMNSALVVCSDDDGRAWKTLYRYECPFGKDIGMAEPGVYVRENGDIWNWMRTCAGHQYQCVSKDGGQTVSAPVPNFCFSSPDSPMRVRKCGKYLVAVFNPVPFYCSSEFLQAGTHPRRTPLVCAVSEDDGDSFGIDGDYCIDGHNRGFVENCYLLESDRDNTYCYPAIQPVEGGFLVAYYHSNNSGFNLNSTRILKVGYEELAK